MKNKVNQNNSNKFIETKKYLVRLEGYGKIGLKNQKNELIVLENNCEIDLTEQDIKLLESLNLNTDKILMEII